MLNSQIVRWLALINFVPFQHPPVGSGNVVRPHSSNCRAKFCSISVNFKKREFSRENSKIRLFSQLNVVFAAFLNEII